MAELRSHIIMGGDDAPFYRSLFKSMGYTDYELDDKPIHGILLFPVILTLIRYRSLSKRVFTVRAEPLWNLELSAHAMVLPRAISA